MRRCIRNTPIGATLSARAMQPSSAWRMKPNSMEGSISGWSMRMASLLGPVARDHAAARARARRLDGRRPAFRTPQRARRRVHGRPGPAARSPRYLPRLQVPRPLAHALVAGSAESASAPARCHAAPRSRSCLLVPACGRQQTLSSNGEEKHIEANTAAEISNNKNNSYSRRAPQTSHRQSPRPRCPALVNHTWGLPCWSATTANC